MPAFTLADATEQVIDYVLTNECGFAVELMSVYDDFEPWAEYVLSETTYGAVMVLAFRDYSDSEMLRDLKELWEEKGPVKKNYNVA